MQRGSIAAALFWLSAAWLVVALVATAFLLTDLYSRALDTSLTETLEFHMGTLVEATLDSRSPESEEITLGDPRYSRPRTGWYWAIREEAGAVLNLSPSLTGISIPGIGTPFDQNRTRTAAIRDPYGIDIRVIERLVTVDGRTMRFTVTGNLDEIWQLVDAFRGQAFTVLGAVGVMLAVMSAIVARIALRPIGRLRAAIERVREGETQSVTGTFPREIAPLAQEVNELLRSNAGIIERARNQVGNLAHGLKTPLAVLRNEAQGASKTPLATIVLSESDKMTAMVSSYLDKARLAARTTIVGKKTDPTAVMVRLARVMEKLNPHCTVTLRPPDAALPWFRGDESDLEEMAGNLLDNACKWCRGQVAVSMVADRADGGNMLLIRIEDNGPGLTEEESTRVLERGVRLDEKTPGSGLGLDIVKELVGVYGGRLELRRSQLGGLLAELRLPAAKLGSLQRA